jgi:hypothetical protein
MRLAVSRLSSLRIVLGCVFLSCLAAGCSDPTAVRRFASVAKTAGESFSLIADDFPRSCERRERYRLLGNWRSDLDSLDEETTRSCAKYTKAAPRLIGANRVLVRYLTALGELSAGDLVTYDDSLGELAKALDATGMLDENGVGAAKSVCAVLADMSAGKWRRNKLGSVIEKTNPDIQTLAAALRGIISIDYAQLLDDESEAARKFYLGTIRDYRDDEPLTSVLIYDKWQKEEGTIENKRHAAETYVKVLDKIAKGHQELFDRRGQLDTKEARKLLLKHVTAIEELLTGVQGAF